MAGFFQQVLQGAAEGFFGNDTLRDFTHASKTFVTNGFGNAPKFKYLFHVYFEINNQLTGTIGLDGSNSMLPGLLVKNISLPKYSMNLAEMNQYNRKRYVQTKLNYDPVSISFHDDNLGAVKKMWYNYYSYYYNDVNTARLNETTIAIKDTYQGDISNHQNWGYLGEPSTSATAAALNQPKPQFFKTIKIYGFNQHSFSLYNLINPIIERFEHDTYDYYQPTGTMENRMTVRYETVTYEEGAVNGQTPDAVVQGFGTDQYYDRRLSPISRPGSNRTIMGQGGLFDAGAGVLNDLSQVPPNILGAIQKAGTAAKTFKNPQTILTTAKSELVAGALAAASNPQTVRGLFNIPANGAGSYGTNAQTSASNNIKNTQAPAIPVDSNNPAGGGV